MQTGRICAAALTMKARYKHALALNLKELRRATNDHKGLILTVVYGISNCDTVRKARKWLLAHDITHRFHDFRTDGFEQSQLQRWLLNTAFSSLINKRSTSWRQLSDAERELLSSKTINENNSEAQNMAVAIVLKQPTLIKRPVLELAKQAVMVGFSEQTYGQTFKR